MSKVEYFKLKGLENLYLEDSYVLAIVEAERQIRFIMEFVLTEDHPKYHKPYKDEQYCYKKGHILFEDVQKYSWIEKSLRPIPDGCGNFDYGNIDAFLKRKDCYFLAGEWGEIEIFSDPPIIEYYE